MVGPSWSWGLAGGEWIHPTQAREEKAEFVLYNVTVWGTKAGIKLQKWMGYGGFASGSWYAIPTMQMRVVLINWLQGLSWWGDNSDTRSRLTLSNYVHSCSSSVCLAKNELLWCFVVLSGMLPWTGFVRCKFPEIDSLCFWPLFRSLYWQREKLNLKRQVKVSPSVVSLRWAV